MPVNDCTLHQAQVGAAKLAEKGMTGERWRREMEAEFGDYARENWKAIFNESYRLAAERTKAARQAALERAAVRHAGEQQPREGGELFDDEHAISAERMGELVEAYETARRNARDARVGLAQSFHALQKSTGLQIVVALRKAGLLTGVKTHGRNLGGNLIFQGLEEAARNPAAITDAVVSAVTGQRTVTPTDVRAIARGAYHAATQGVREAKEIMKHGAPLDDLVQLKIPRELITNSRILDGYVNFVFRSLAAEDRVFRAYAFRRALEERARARALTERRSDRSINVRERTEELVNAAPEDLVADAIFDAEVSTFNNRNELGARFSQMKQGMMASEHAGARALGAAIDFYVPFANTPSNVFARLFEYAPVSGQAMAAGRLGLLVSKRLKTGGWHAATQRQFALSVGRSSIGTALVALGAALFRHGIAEIGGESGGEDNLVGRALNPSIGGVRPFDVAANYLSKAGVAGVTGTRDDDKSRSDRDTGAGRSAMSLRIGGSYYQIGGFAPFGMLLALGATLQREHDQVRQDPGSAVAKMAAASLNLATEQPMLKGVKDFTDTISAPGGAPAKAGSLVGSMIPTAVSDIASVFDSKRRDTQSFTGQVANRVPFARNYLPEAFDALGRPLEQQRANAVNPAIRSTAKEASDPVDRELVRLDVGVSRAQRKPGESDEDLRARQLETGKAAYGMLQATIASDAYKGLPKELQRKTLEDVVTKSKSDPATLATDFDRQAYAHNQEVNARRLQAVDRLERDPAYQALEPDAQQAARQKVSGRFAAYRFEPDAGESEKAAAARLDATRRAFRPAAGDAALDGLVDQALDSKAKKKRATTKRAPKPFPTKRPVPPPSSNYQ